MPSSEYDPAVPEAGTTTPEPTRIRMLVIARGIDQAALGLGSLLLARHLGPTDFAPVAVLFIVNSLALQVADFGLVLAVLKVPPGTTTALSSLWRLRGANSLVLLVAVAAGVVVGGDAGVFVAAGGVLWVLNAEVAVRKAACLKQERVTTAAMSEIAGAVVFGLGIVAVIAGDAGVAQVAGVFVAKQLVEIVLLRGWAGAFASDGVRANAGPEWLSQVFTYLIANVDYVLIALLRSPEDLSVYVVAFRVASVAPALLARPITHAAYIDLPAAAPESRQGVYDGLMRKAGRSGLVGVVVVLVLALLIPLFLGSDWVETGQIMAILAVAVPWRMVLGVTVAVAITSGHAWKVVRWESMRMIAMAVAVVVGASIGLVATATAVAVATIGTIAVEHDWATRIAWLSPRRSVRRGAVGGVVVATAVGLVISVVA